MNQLTGTQPGAWPTPAPAGRQTTAGPATKRRWTVGQKLAAVATAAAFVAILAAAATTDKQNGSGGGSIVVKAGWDATHVANLSIKISDDDGLSSTQADCAAEAIAGSMTFLGWESLSPAGQFGVIRAAEAGC